MLYIEKESVNNLITLTNDKNGNDFESKSKKHI